MKRCLSFLIAPRRPAPRSRRKKDRQRAKGAAGRHDRQGLHRGLRDRAVDEARAVRENADVPLPTASMAKMMTCLIAMEEIRDGRLKLDTPVTISARASNMGGSQIFAKQGQVFPMQTLLAGHDGAVGQRRRGPHRRADRRLERELRRADERRAPSRSA